MKVPARVFELIAASGDHTHNRGLHLKRRGADCTAVATDGKQLTIARWIDVSKPPKGFAATISNRGARDAARVFCGGMVRLRVLTDDRMLARLTAADDTELVVALEPQAFANYSLVVEKPPGDGYRTIRLSGAALLNQLQLLLKVSKGKHPCSDMVEIRFHETEPTRLWAPYGDMDVECFLMPIVVTGEEEV